MSYKSDNDCYDKMDEFHKSNNKSAVSGSVISTIINEESERDKTVKIQQNFIDEYKKSTEAINSVLKKAGCTLDTFPNEFQEKVNNIAELATSLNISDPSPTSLLFGISALENMKMELRKKEKFQVYNMSKLTKNLNIITKRNQDIQKNLEDKESKVKMHQAQQLKQQSHSANYLQPKCDNYATIVEDMQVTLDNLGFEPKYCHKELIEEAKKLRKIKEEADALVLKLQSYQNLPPDHDLALLKLEEARAELFKLEKEFEANSVQHFGASEDPESYMQNFHNVTFR